MSDQRRGDEDPSRRSSGDQLLHHGVTDGPSEGTHQAENAEPVPDPDEASSADPAVEHPNSGGDRAERD